jgi:hypothetical protein
MESTNNHELLHDKNLLIIGGTGRNVGKTTLALEIIKKNSRQHPVLGLKVSTQKKGDEEFHGSHSPTPIDTYRINIEKGLQPHKDTAAMMQAGATEAFYIETTDEFVKQAWLEFSSSYNKMQNAIVCESRSLRKFVKPGLFILLIDPNNLKDSSLRYKELADYIYYYNNDISGIIKLAQSIDFTADGWMIHKRQSSY